MTVRSRIIPSDEEYGKRDDDMKRKKQANGWLPKGPSTPWLRRKRLPWLLVVVVCVYLFVHNIPNLGPQDSRYMRRYRGGRARPEPREPLDNGEDLWRQAQQAKDEAPEAPPSPNQERDVDTQDFEGPVRFYSLASSLHAISKTSGQRTRNRNVLFAASDLKSAGDLVLMACEMSRWRKNNVHMALMGRDDMPIEEIKKVNGIDESTCHVFWHDARPDYPKRSTPHRMEVSIAGALGHIETFMHPQAVITNYPEHEDEFFVRSIKRKTKELVQTHIELPRSASDHLKWLTRLDATALHNWHAATIDIVVQAPQDSSGSLVRLLTSLEKADYGAFFPPRLTIELPHKLNQDVMTFLDYFEWPPKKYQNHLPYQQLTLHRRIPEKRLSEYEASTRFLESFYPFNTMDSHVLILSSQAEVSPSYFHYLKYHLLEYRYSTDSFDLFGLSLETPSSYLNGTGSFTPPKPQKNQHDDDDDFPMPFLWQAPNAGAALIFADKWVELHSFLTQYFAASRHPSTEEYLEHRTKQVSDRLPSWTEYLLDLMRTRGYYYLYPGSASDAKTGTSLAVIHGDLYQVPEERLRPFKKQDADTAQLSSSKDILEEGDFSYLNAHHPSSEDEASNAEHTLLRNLERVLPAVPDSVTHPAETDDPPRSMPPLESLAMLDYLGVGITPDELTEKSTDFAVEYRQKAGGCSKAESHDRHVIHGNAEDLFCISDNHDNSDEESFNERAASTRSSGSGSRQKDPDDKSDRGSEKPTTTQQAFRGTGAASTVNAVTAAEEYAATAAAGFKAKVEGKDRQKYEDEVPLINLKDTKLTTDERKELESKKNSFSRVDSDPVRDAKLGNSESVETDDREGDRPAGAAGAGGGPKDAEAERRGGSRDTQTAPKGKEDTQLVKADKDGKEKPEATQKQPTEQPDEAGARPQPTDAQSTKGSEAGKKEFPHGKGSSNMPPEAQEVAIGGKREAAKGRIGGWDIGGYDEEIRDERAAAAGKLDFAKNRGREKQAEQPKDVTREEPDMSRIREKDAR